MLCPFDPLCRCRNIPELSCFFFFFHLKSGTWWSSMCEVNEMMVAEIVMHTREKYTWSLVPERPPLCIRCYDDVGQNVCSEFFITCYRKTGTEFLANAVIQNHCWNRSWIHFFFPMTSGALFQTLFSLLPQQSLAPPQSNPQGSQFHS